jgi:2-succinyl-5-enolpyruvyl-6-hydroxy-3-cyclohexene-1-carboxylate synthase
MAVALYNLQQLKRVSVTTHYDERGAAFYALGLAKATQKPVAIVTTSGTAVANLLPAIVEAKKSQAAVIVLTCDRPQELIFSGANQTIVQSDLLSSSVVYTHTLPAPDPNIPESTIGYTVAHAVAIARAEKAPIHINIPFREPLSENPSTGFPVSVPEVVVGIPQIQLPNHVTAMLCKAKRGVFVVGSGTDPDPVLTLAKAYRWPVIPDVCSPLRYFADPLIITYADLLATENGLEDSDCILHIGNPITGKNTSDWLQKQTCPLIRIHHRDDFGDPISHATYIGIGDMSLSTLHRLSVIPSGFEIPTASPELVTDSLSKSASECLLFHHWDQWLPRGWGLFLGNSQPIRQIGKFAAASTRPMLAIGSNRGASGIDGLVATAGGFMRGHAVPGVLILGDLSFLHDVSSLPLVASQPLLILVIQNNGGEIFSRFPVKDHPCFTDFFHLTHAHSCSAAAEWALGYTKRISISDSEHEIQSACEWIRNSGKAALLEIVVA